MNVQLYISNEIRVRGEGGKDVKVKVKSLPTTICGRCEHGTEITTSNATILAYCSRVDGWVRTDIETCTDFRIEHGLTLHKMEDMAFIMETSLKGKIGFITPREFSKKYPNESPSKQW